MSNEENKKKKAKVKRNVRDSVFHVMIENPKFLRMIYLSLYPGDDRILEEELKLIDHRTAFLGGLAHDCCFNVRNRKSIFLEVQSSPCKLLPERMIRYYAFIMPYLNKEFEKYQYSANGTDMPEAEFWVIYVGPDADKMPERLYLAGRSSPEKNLPYVPVNVKTMYNDNGFIGEYCTFSYIYLAHYARCRDVGEAVEMTLRECLESGILKEFLEEHMSEVKEILHESNVYYFQKYCEGLAENARAEGNATGRAEGRVEGRAEGRAEGRVEGRAEERTDMLRKMKTLLSESGYSSSEINGFIGRLNSMA